LKAKQKKKLGKMEEEKGKGDTRRCNANMNTNFFF